MLTKIKHFFCNADPSNLAFCVIVIPAIGFCFYQIGFLQAFALVAALVIIFGIMFGIGYYLHRLIKWAQSHCEDSDV